MYNESSLPYWRNTDDIYEFYRTGARRHDDGLVKMRGTFRAALLNEFTYDNIFVPTDDGEPTFVIPVFEGCRVIDIVAIGNNVWGCVTGAGQYIGTLANPLRAYRSPRSWLEGDIGILILAKSFYETLFAESVIAEDAARAKISL